MTFEDMRNQMVETQIIRRGIRNDYVLEAMRTVPRHQFVKKGNEADSYSDHPLPIGHNQTISQPYIVALMIELLKPQPSDVVLEVGSGCGYAAAVLAEIVKKVYGIEVVEPLAEASQHRLINLGYTNVEIINKDGKEGLPNHAPFDKILISAAAKGDVPQELLHQLKVGGKLVAPIDNGFSQELVVITKKSEDSFEKNKILGVRFVPLI